MLRYEALMLTVPAITGDETKNLETSLDKLIQKQKGTMLSFERWGKFKLSYPVKKNDYGVYFLARFETPKDSTTVQDIKALFNVKLNNVVMRELVGKLDPEQTLAYQRPKSLEEAPTRDVETFLKENKMEGLLSAVDKEKKEEKTEKVAKEASAEEAEPAAEKAEEVSE